MKTKLTNLHIPAWFWILLVCLILKQLIWVAFVPLWQFPDEQAHFAQVQNAAEGRGAVIVGQMTTSREIYESEKIMGTDRDGMGNNKYTYHPEFNIEYSQSLTGLEEKIITSFPQEYRNEMVISEASFYPPPYYYLSASLYRIFYGSDLLTRVFVTRILNTLLMVFYAYVIWQIGETLFGKRKLLVITYTFLVLFHPMLSFVYGGINSDNLFNLIFASALFVALQMLRRGINVKRIALFGVIVLLAHVTKPQGFLVLALFPFIIAATFLRSPKGTNSIVKILVVVLLLALSYPIIRVIKGENLATELPPFSELSNLSFTSYFSHIKNALLETYRQIVPWYWGVYRWLSLTYPRPIHRLINWSLVISLCGFILLVLKYLRRKKLQISFTYVSFLLYTTVVYFLAITTFDYLFRLHYNYSIGIQGRYFFPVLPAHMALMLIGLNHIFTLIKLQQLGLKLLGVGLVLLHSYAMVFLFGSYFTLKSLGQFFIQASQYKPAFFKSPFLETITVVSLLSTGLLIWYYLRIKPVKDET